MLKQQLLLSLFICIKFVNTMFKPDEILEPDIIFFIADRSAHI